MNTPWDNPSDAPVIEQSIHDYIVSIFRAQRGRRLEIVPISPGAEASRGWDAAVLEVVPLFFQYKLPDFTSRPTKSQPHAAKFRKDIGFNDDNGFFHFKLRKKAAKEPRSQHELMLEMEKEGYAVYYVATDFIDNSRLRWGGDLHAGARPWISRNHRIVDETRSVYDFLAPWFDGLICIPPFTEVSAPVENHRFIYNSSLEVSLHSDPTQAYGTPLLQILEHQSFNFGTELSITEKNVDRHVNFILSAIAGGAIAEKRLTAIEEYYNSLRPRSDEYRSSLMGKLRPLAHVIKTLVGIDVFFTARHKHGRPFRM
ncbi:hypothetical protein ACIPL1_07670 [Pseudomonas sp. NPDC090202]|uniref:hypothetical protein n=1 Tax=Pseudomonas sp. NPDC090202 TaxID=3364476 RepID=UPI0037FB1DF6